MAQCFFCDTEVIWQNDFDAADYGYEDDGIVGVYVCPECGAEYEVHTYSNKEGSNDK